MASDSSKIDAEYAALMAYQEEQERAARIAKGLPPEEEKPVVDEIAKADRLAKGVEARARSMAVVEARRAAMHEMFEKAERGMGLRPDFRGNKRANGRSKKK